MLEIACNDENWFYWIVDRMKESGKPLIHEKIEEKCRKAYFHEFHPAYVNQKTRIVYNDKILEEMKETEHLF